MSPGTVARERARLGLDQPIARHYLSWLGRAVRLDLGTSFRYQRPVAGLVGERAANTALLAVAALALATLTGLPLGVVSGSREGGVTTSMIRAGSVAALSVPPLITSLAFVFVAARTGWFPVGGMTSPVIASAGVVSHTIDVLWHLIVPALALGLPIAASIERIESRAMAETLGEPFVFAARARGIPERRVLWRHALRVSIRPVAGIYGLIFGSLLSGSFAVEIITAWPGLGRLTYEALTSRDVHLVAGCALAGSIFLAAGAFVSDAVLAWADPRAHLES